MQTKEKICPYCNNVLGIKTIPIMKDNSKKIVYEDEKFYYETDKKKQYLTNFYYCPFCARPLKGRKVSLRKFREI